MSKNSGYLATVRVPGSGLVLVGGILGRLTYGIIPFATVLAFSAAHGFAAAGFGEKRFTVRRCAGLKRPCFSKRASMPARVRPKSRASCAGVRPRSNSASSRLSSSSLHGLPTFDGTSARARGAAAVDGVPALKRSSAVYRARMTSGC